VLLEKVHLCSEDVSLLSFASFLQRFSLSLYKALKESTEKLHLINAKKKLNEE